MKVVEAASYPSWMIWSDKLLTIDCPPLHYINHPKKKKKKDKNQT